MAPETTNVECVLNLAEAMSNMDGDAELLEEIVGIFMATGREQLAAIGAAIGAGAAKDVSIKSHAMKGGASNFCAHRFVASALTLEMLAKGGSLEGADALLAAMQANYAELEDLVGLINWAEVASSWSR